MSGGTLIYPELSYKLIGILFEVYNDLGYGYNEKFYQKAVETALYENGIEYRPQAPYKISYKGNIIGRNYLDLVIEDKIVLELKQGRRFTRKHYEQIYAYLKVTNMKLGILASFMINDLKFRRILNIK